MTDIKTIMSWLDGLTEPDWRMFHSDSEVQTIAKETLDLLKEQEPKTGHWVSVDDGGVVAIDNDGYTERACFCSECKKYLIGSNQYGVYGRYCPFCGAKMESR